MRSALTAALSGQPNDPATAPPEQQQQPTVSKKLDPGSFPCIQEDTISPLQSELGGLKLEDRDPVGSVPTAGLLPNGSLAADYEINPRSRRGGQEVLPTASLDDKARWQSIGSASLKSNYIADSVIGSLPRGLSMKERTEISQSIPQSPMMSIVSSMPSAKLGSRSLDSFKLRRHLLHGAVVVFVTAGYSGKRFIFEKAKELGVRSVVLDGPDSWVQELAKDKIIEQFVPLDFSESTTVFDRCLAAIVKARKSLGELDGVLTFCEMAVPLVARLAEKLGVPGNTPDSIDAARDKHSTRSMMAAAKLPSPRNHLITEPTDVNDAATKVGFPAVIKPIFGAASMGVVRVNDKAQLDAAYARVQKEMANARIEAGALVQGHPSEDGTPGNADTWIKTTLMLEEYMDGPEVDVDLVFSEGQPVYGAITDNWPTVEPYFNETGSNCPSILPASQQQELITLAVQSCQALGLTLGVFHVELKYTSRGPRLIEVNCRMGGGPVRDTNLRVWGVDLVEEHLLASLGIPTKPLILKQPREHIAEYSVNAKKTGRMENLDWLKKWQGHPDVLYANYLVKVGQKVTSVEHGMPTWVAELMVRKPTVQESIDFITAIEAGLQVPIA